MGSITNGRANLGQDPLIVDAVEWGGISGRLSTGFTYADTSMVLAVVKSDPAGFVTETSNYLDMNSTVTTSSLHGATNGYNFAYWSINGVRQAGPTGVSMSKVDRMLPRPPISLPTTNQALRIQTEMV